MRFVAILRYRRNCWEFPGTLLQFLYPSRNIYIEKGGDVDG